MEVGKLTALAVQRATKPGMINDGAGLYLQVGPNGSKSWLLRYRRSGRSHYLGLGPAHTVTLAKARERAAEARLALLEGRRDPIEARRASRAAAAKAMTFAQAAEAFIKDRAAGWRGSASEKQWRASLEHYALPHIGDMPVGNIDTADVLRVLTPIWSEKTITGGRLRGRIETILDAAKARGMRGGENPARWRGHLDHLLPQLAKVARVEHHPALPYVEIAAFMAQLRKCEGVAARALEFLVLTATRTAEARDAKWSEIDLGQKLWVIPATRTKAEREHRIPLSDRALAILEEMLSIRDSERVFPGRRGRPLGRQAIADGLKDIRDDLTVHGFRSTFRDWAGNETSFPRELAEQALAHSVGDTTERSYRRGDALERRRKMMDAWARYSSGRGTVVSLSENKSVREAR